MYMQPLHRRAGRAALAGVFAAFLGGAWAQAQPPVTDWTSLQLPTPDGLTAWSASGFNNLGQVIGTANRIGLPYVAPVFYDGTMSRVLPAPADTWTTQAVAINDAGQVLVQNRAVEEGPPYASGSRTSITLHSGGRMTEIVPAGVRDATAVDLNNRGEVLMSGNLNNRYVSLVTGPSGTRYLAAGGAESLDLNNNGVVLYRDSFQQGSPLHLDDHGTVTGVGPADRFVSAWRLSDRDEVWGTVAQGPGPGLIASFVGGVATPLPGNRHGYVGDVNDRGDVLLELTDHPRTSFLYRGGALTDLGAGIAGLTAADGLSVNNAGQVLFMGEFDWGARRYLYFWDNGTVTNLTELLYRELGDAAARYRIGGVWLNDAGQVLFSGDGYDLGPLLLSPVPEPGMLALTLAGMLVLLCVRRTSAGASAA